MARLPAYPAAFQAHFTTSLTPQALGLASLQRHQGSQSLAETHDVGQQSWGSHGKVSVTPETGTRHRTPETHWWQRVCWNLHLSVPSS